MDAPFLKVDSRPGWMGFEQLGLVKGVPAHGRSGVDLNDL